jgi:cysteine-rich repeat protein
MEMRRGFGAAEVWALTMFVLGTAATGCVKQTEAVSCPTGIYCPAGAKCAARQAACIFDLCGNGVVDPGEVCDDGNIISGDGCSADCQSNETCGNGKTDPGEICDEGVRYDTTTCSHNCQSAGICGDTFLNLGEQCDPGWVGTDSTTCTKDCKISRCGDGYVNTVAGEACDDGNGNDGDNCVECQWAFCGDGFVNLVGTTTVHDGIKSPLEECDDGLANTSDPNCPYGGTCAPCSTTCQKLTPKLHYCGDGTVDAGHETCDNIKQFACGTCDPETCATVSVATAKGWIEVLSTTSIVDGDSFTLDDGAVTTPYTFELDVDGACQEVSNRTKTVRCVDLTTSLDPVGVASAIRAKIDNTSLQIATVQGNPPTRIWLENTAPVGVAGNVPIETSGSSFDPGGAVTVNGMSDAAGCAINSACKVNEDCVSGDCHSGSCR